MGEFITRDKQMPVDTGSRSMGGFRYPVPEGRCGCEGFDERIDKCQRRRRKDVKGVTGDPEETGDQVLKTAGSNRILPGSESVTGEKDLNAGASVRKEGMGPIEEKRTNIRFKC